MIPLASFGGQCPLWYVYVLKCSDHTYYIGRTTDFDERMARHTAGRVSYTRPRRPLQLVTYTAFTDEWTAIRFENYLKSGSGRAFAKRHFL